MKTNFSSYANAFMFPSRLAKKQRRRPVYITAMIVAAVQPIMVLPQVIQIFSTQSAADVSLLTWGALLIFNASNLNFGLVYGIKPQIINNAIWVVVDALVVVGVLLYR
jgi:uncharacterized protein with PQ loop repeat